MYPNLHNKIIKALVCLLFYTMAYSISKKEKAQINKWLALNKKILNQYGDPISTVYRRNVLVNSYTGGRISVYEYIKKNYPHAPWSTIAITTPSSSEKTTRAMNRWLKDNHLNIYGDPELTWYKLGENPLIMDGTKVSPAERVKRLFPHKPWKQKKK